MEDNPELPEVSPDASGEKKCEREFRKLFQEVGCGSSNATYGKNKSTYHGNVKKKNKVDTFIVPKEKDPISEILYPESKQPTYNLDNLYEDLRRSNKAEQRCQSLIRLAHFCSEEISKEQLTTVINALGLLSDSHEYDTLVVAHALFLLSLTTKRLTSDQLIDVEESVLDVANSISLRKHAFKSNADVPRLSILKGEEYWTSCKLLQQFAEECQDIDSVDVLTICCTSLKNLSFLPTGYAYKYSPCTVKFVLGMTGKVTQEIVSEILEYSEDYPCVNSPTYAANQCLKILEHMLSVDPDMQFQDLDHEDFSLLHCLTRLLGWSLSFPFVPKNDPSAENQDSLSSFHLSTLVSNLKILSVLSFNPETLDSFTNAKGLMEKVMICILKAYFHSTENHFDVLVLALEIMINFYLKRKRTFVLLCLKKFRVNSEEIRSIEGLLKILSNSLEKIRSFKSKSFQPEDEKSNTEAEELKFVLEIADEDMELSTIVAFICILVVFFMETKTSFLEFIRERLSVEVTEEAIIVSNKVLEFAAITGGMPVTGILLLKHAIKKLSQLYRTS